MKHLFLACFTDLNQIQHTDAYHLKKFFLMLLDESSPTTTSSNAYRDVTIKLT